MKDNFIHVCFVIDESGSMSGTEDDVIGGFKKVVDEQKAVKDGTCSISYFKFSSGVEEVYIGKDVNEVEYLDGKYNPHGLTALFDGVGTAIDKIGEWIDKMPEDEKPEKKHQEDKYNWSFIYMGSDLKDAHDANSLGFGTKLYASKANHIENYSTVNDVLCCYRTMAGSVEAKSDLLNQALKESAIEKTTEYAADNGLDAKDLL